MAKSGQSIKSTDDFDSLHMIKGVPGGWHTLVAAAGSIITLHSEMLNPMLDDCGLKLYSGGKLSSFATDCGQK